MGALARIEIHEESAPKKKSIDALMATWSRLRGLGLPDDQIQQALEPVLKLLHSGSAHV